MNNLFLINSTFVFVSNDIEDEMFFHYLIIEKQEKSSSVD
jgi:hypothetical protein